MIFDLDVVIDGSFSGRLAWRFREASDVPTDRREALADRLLKKANEANLLTLLEMSRRTAIRSRTRSRHIDESEAQDR
jgi:hypothetical protein